MDKQEMLRKYLDNELSEDQEKEVLHIIAEDPEMREMLRFERQLDDAVPELDFSAQYEVPGDFTDRVMHRIEQEEPVHSEAGTLQKVRNWAALLWKPQTVTWRPAYGMALAVISVLVMFSPLYLVPYKSSEPESVAPSSPTVQQVSTASREKVWVRFVYVDENAESIAVAGDFNNWEAEPLTKQQVNGEQVWTGLVPMKRGEHRYMFVKNGSKWVTDPMAPVHREDGFGNKNAVIYL